MDVKACSASLREIDGIAADDYLEFVIFTKKEAVSERDFMPLMNADFTGQSGKGAPRTAYRSIYQPLNDAIRDYLAQG